MLKIRRPLGRLIFNMGIALLIVFGKYYVQRGGYRCLRVMYSFKSMSTNIITWSGISRSYKQRESEMCAIVIGRWTYESLACQLHGISFWDPLFLSPSMPDLSWNLKYPVAYFGAMTSATFVSTNPEHGTIYTFSWSSQSFTSFAPQHVGYCIQQLSVFIAGVFMLYLLVIPISLSM